MDLTIKIDKRHTKAITKWTNMLSGRNQAENRKQWCMQMKKITGMVYIVLKYTKLL